MADDRMPVMLGNTRVLVPIVRDKKTTLELADSINDRLKRLEEESDRIDTQRFALQTAFEFAAEAFLANAGTREEEAQILRRLDSIRTRLHALNTEIEGG